MRALILSAAAALSLWGWSRSGRGLEELYARHLFPPIGQTLQALTGWAPFSFFEAGVIVLVGLLLRGLWRAKGLRGYGRVLRISATVACLGYAYFMLAWGLNYGRARLAKQQGWDTGGIAGGEVAAAAADQLRAVQETWAALPPEIATDAGSRLPYPRRALASKIDPGYRRLAWLDYAPAREWDSAPGKPVWLLFRPGTTAGMYSPWTAEAQYGFDLPDATLPFTVAHELAHVRGFAREDEANLLAYAASRAADDPYVRYSGALKGFRYLIGALHRSDKEAAQGLRAQLPAGARADIEATNAYWRSKPQNLMKVGDKIYDTYLKSQGVAAGRRSYSQMVRLVIYLRRAEKTGDARVTMPTDLQPPPAPESP